MLNSRAGRVIWMLWVVAACGSDPGRTREGEATNDTSAESAAFQLADTVAMPQISPNGGTVSGSVQVTMTSATRNAKMYYTLDGSEPSNLSKLYTGPFVLSVAAPVTVKAKGFRNRMTPSAVAQASFIPSASLPPPPPPPQGDDCSQVVDSCPVAGGVTWQCKKRFMHGVNYAWRNFGADFGGLAAWGINGVAKTPVIDTEFADIKAQGGNVIRWWVMPNFRSDGIVFDSNDKPVRLGGTFIDDLNAALALAEKHNVYLMLNLFSFDNFNPTTTSSGVRIRGLQPIVLDAIKRQALLENVIRPMAKAVQASPYRKRMMAWDVINEPEWAIIGGSKYGDQDFNCNSSLQCLTHDQMESFLRDVTAVLRSESGGLVTVGGAAIKWAKAWSQLNLDFYQFHTYDWVNEWYPYSNSPAFYGITDKPVVMGEYPLTGLKGVPVPTMLTSWLKNNYGGALGWAMTDAPFNWAGTKTNILNFAQQNSCVSQY